MTKKLIVHIGTGKTGSTAIQKCLRLQRPQLNDQGFYYWGLNLEHAPSRRRRDWQQPGGIAQLQKMSKEEATSELTIVLEESLSEVQEGSTIIWSNESIYEMPDVYQPVFKAAQANHDVTIILIAYARSMPSFILSAYKQWGVKHKTYPGPVKSFRGWVAANKNFLAYSRKLLEWDKAFPGQFKIYNYDSLDDVVEHFTAHSLIPVDASQLKEAARQNESPDDILLAIYALHNSRFPDPVLPSRIAQLLAEGGLAAGINQIGNLAKIYPSKQDLDEETAFINEETQCLNQILQRQNQPLFNEYDSSEDIASINQAQMVSGVMSILLALIIQQDDRIKQLESSVALQGKG